MTPFKIALLALLCMGLARAAEEAENAADTIDIASYLECSSGQFWYSYNYNWTLDASVPVAQQSCVNLGSVESDTDKEPAQLLTNFDASYTTTALYNVYGTLKFKCGVTSVCTTLDGIVLSNNCSSNSYNLASANLNNGFTCNFWGTISNLSKVKENKVTVTFKTSTCTKTATVCLEEKASVELHRCIVVSQDDSGIAHSGLTIVSGPGEDKMYCASKNIASASFPGTFEVNVSVVCSASNYELSADVIGDVDDSDVDLVEGVEWCLSLSCGCEPEPEPEPEPCPHPHPPCFPMIPIFFQPIFPFPGPFPCGPQPHPKPDCDDCDDCDDEVAARKTSCSSTKRSSKRCTRSAQPSQALKKRCAK